MFGVSNHQATISYVRKTSGKQDSTNFMKSTEFILVYSKSTLWECKPLLAEDKVTDRYNKEDVDGRKYRETDLRKTGSGDRREDRPLMWYPFYFDPKTNDLQVAEKAVHSFVEKGYVEIFPIKPDGSEGRWRWGYSTAVNNLNFLVARIMPKYKDEEKYTVYEKDYIDKNGDVRTVKEHTSWDRKAFNSDNAMLEFKNLGFSNQLFPFPKSSALIKHIVYLADVKDGYILDFFSGSATTAHSVMQLNAEDGGHRKFIMVQLPEKTDEKSEAYKAGYKNICEIGKERIRRAGNIIMQRVTSGSGNLKGEGWGCGMPSTPAERAYITKNVIDTGFRVLKCDSSNMKDVYYNPSEFNPSFLDAMEDNIKDDRMPEDLLFQVMLDLGILLSSKIQVRNVELGVGNYTYFDVADGFLIACFDKKITTDVITEIAKKQPYYFVMRDNGFADDNVAANFEQIFATYSPDTVRKVL